MSEADFLHLSKPIALIGMMGTGKTSLGKVLAGRLGWRFVDTDHQIEAQQGQTITEIFASQGETAFRAMEAQTIKETVQAGGQCIIATGGGCVENEDSLRLLSEGTILVWLQSSPEEIFARIQQDPARPLLQDADPLQRLTDLLVRRKPFYAKAAIHVYTNDEKPLETLEFLLEKLSEF